MIRLTRPDGSILHLGNGFAVQPVPHNVQVAEAAHALVIYAGANHYVRETVEEVVARIEAAMPE